MPHMRCNNDVVFSLCADIVALDRHCAFYPDHFSRSTGAYIFITEGLSGVKTPTLTVLIELQGHTKSVKCVCDRCSRVQTSSCRRFTRTTRGQWGRRSADWQTARRSWRKLVGSARDSTESGLISWWNRVHTPAYWSVYIPGKLTDHILHEF